VHKCAQPAELAELRLLIELSAVRRLADRGLSLAELGLASKLADDSLRAARRGDRPAYRQADAAFHLGLLALPGDPALTEVARLLVPARPPVAGGRLARDAAEHRELVSLLAEGRASEADQLLRLHLTRRSSP
jgi:DNA-binding GntR family transcriptional regulator